jgi:DNA-binding response OmpR family regulator
MITTPIFPAARRVLIVDDDPSVIAIASHALEHSKMSCETAVCGTDALEMIRRSPPDGIVLDVNMADLDGFTVLLLLRRNRKTRHVPVLLLTARREESDLARGFGYGANDYLVKPFLPFELAIRVEKMIGESQQARATASRSLQSLAATGRAAGPYFK